MFENNLHSQIKNVTFMCNSQALMITFFRKLLNTPTLFKLKLAESRNFIHSEGINHETHKVKN